MTTVIQAVEVKRDGYGYWTHPDMPDFDEGEDAQYKAWLNSQGLLTKYKMLEGENDTHPAFDSYFEHGNPDISAWEPASPAGDGWFTIWIQDTEDGPYWVWARRVELTDENMSSSARLAAKDSDA
ncbi:hypothetical protein [Collimonas arenae]|uniref:hypothetical protein n=1 Tax=Collimonas arenae TaxID=279058 RepID=UPI001C119337|nr:hypothetical protein [Collimonas arenae]